MTPSDRTCYNDSDAPTVTGMVAKCQVCGVQWQVKGGSGHYDNAQGCSFCDAPAKAIVVTSEQNRQDGV